jgi:predicted ATPase
MEEQRASQPSLLQSFHIEGLHGYKNIGMQSKFAATVLIAQNGSGKTTLIAAIDAVLRRQFARLRNLNFHQIRLKIRGIDEELIIGKNQIDEVFDLSEADEISKEARKLDIDPQLLLDFLERQYSAETFKNYDADNPIVYKIITRFDYSLVNIREHCDALRKSYYAKNGHLLRIYELLSQHLNEVEVVYLPTFRRVELPLISQGKTRSGERRKFEFGGGGLYSGDIHFGLEDIPQRLDVLNKRILFESSYSYREISASIINDLLDRNLADIPTDESALPDQEELLLFFTRLKEGGRRGPYMSVDTPDLNRIYGRREVLNDNKFLVYFLMKLNDALTSTRSVEAKVESFIRSCNKYLSGEVSNEVDHGLIVRPTLSESKEMILNRRDLSISVESVPLRRNIPLDALSSGEKQMISLFSKLYLFDDTRKVVLIDEPELSLSLDWQKRVLVDVINTDGCEQLVAITHSPFVFDNELEPFARSITSTLSSFPAGSDDQ